MKRLTFIASLSLLLPCAALAQFDLSSAFNAVKSIAQSQNVANMSEADEIAIGRDVAASTLGAYPLIKDEKLQRKLNTIGEWVALQSPRPALPWRFAAVESASINAFAAPGGIIMVTRGLLSMVTNEAELACVLGHEIGHVSRKHHLALLQKGLLTDAGMNAATAYNSSLNDNPLKTKLLGEGKEIFGKSLDRGAEREADEDGVLLAAKAGYDPAACLVFMQRLASVKGKQNALEALYKTHPQASDRAVDVESALRRLQGATPGEGARPALSLLDSKGKKAQ